MLNEAKLEHAKRIQKAVIIHEREKITTVPPSQFPNTMSPTTLSSSSPLATKNPKSPRGMFGNTIKGDNNNPIPLAFGGWSSTYTISIINRIRILLPTFVDIHVCTLDILMISEKLRK